MRADTIFPAIKSERLERNSGIDLLRGISIVLVVLHHIGLRIPLKNGMLAAFLPRRFLNGLIYNGYEAVFIFFVISGFLIASHTLARWGTLREIRLKTFYGQRAARILPSLLALLGVLSALHLAGLSDFVISRTDQSLSRALLAALGLHLNWYEGVTGYLPANWDVLWSLSIEEAFYLGFPVICLTVRREKVLMPILVMFALSLPGWHALLAGNDIWQEKAYLPGMAAIAMGVLGALVAARVQPRTRAIRHGLMVVGVIGLAAVFFFEDYVWRWLGSGTLLVLSLSALSLLLGFQWLAAAGVVSSLPGTVWLRSCGRLSYEIYLTHMFIVWPVVHAYVGSGTGPTWAFLWYVPALLLSWLMGWLLARYFSVPCERALRCVLAGAAGKSKTAHSPIEVAGT